MKAVMAMMFASLTTATLALTGVCDAAKDHDTIWIEYSINGKKVSKAELLAALGPPIPPRGLRQPDPAYRPDKDPDLNNPWKVDRLWLSLSIGLVLFLWWRSRRPSRD